LVIGPHFQLIIHTWWVQEREPIMESGGRVLVGARGQSPLKWLGGKAPLKLA